MFVVNSISFGIIQIKIKVLIFYIYIFIWLQQKQSNGDGERPMVVLGRKQMTAYSYNYKNTTISSTCLYFMLTQFCHLRIFSLGFVSITRHVSFRTDNVSLWLQAHNSGFFRVMSAVGTERLQPTTRCQNVTILMCSRGNFTWHLHCPPWIWFWKGSFIKKKPFRYRSSLIDLGKHQTSNAVFELIVNAVDHKELCALSSHCFVNVLFRDRNVLCESCSKGVTTTVSVINNGMLLQSEYIKTVL